MEQKQSGLGIASFVLSIVSTLLLFVLFIVAGIMEISTPGGIDEDSPQTIALGLTIILCVIGEMVAIGLGIAAVCQSDRKKVLGILGLVFSSTAALMTLLLIALGS